MAAPYLGDFEADQPVNFMWDTNDGDGASITRSTDGTISVYKDNSDGAAYDDTQVTTDVTNDEDFDSLTGVHTCCITTTDGWYEIGHDYAVVLSASTIDTQTVNAVLAMFSIENRPITTTDFEARTLPSADYVVVGDTIAGVTAVSNEVTADAVKISGSSDAADKLEASAETIVIGTVSHDNTAASTTVFYSDDITEATADHYNGRIVIFTSGDLTQQATDITDYALVSGEGQFTVTALTEAPADNVTFVIV